MLLRCETGSSSLAPITIHDTKTNDAANGPGKLAITDAANHGRRSCCTRHVSGRSALSQRVWRQSSASQPTQLHGNKHG